MFGLFKKRVKYEASEIESTAAAPITALVPVIPDETRLAQLGPVLWQDVRYGMTHNEVKGVCADVGRSVNGENLDDGSIADLLIPHLKLGSHDYSVKFYFKNMLLSQVTVATNGGPESVDFRDLANALRLRYGKEVEMRESTDSFCTAEWICSSGINVSLVFYAGIGCLNVNFQYRYADTARQL